MKILYHHRTISKDGQDVHIAEMIAAFRQLGHEVITVEPGGGKASFGSDGGGMARLRRHIPRAVGEVLELAYSLVAYGRLYAAWKRHRPDIIYERYNLFLLAGWWLKRRTGIRYFLEVNSPLAEERAKFGGLALPWLARWSERVVWRGADRVLPVTDVLADHLRAAGVKDSRIQVISNGINRARFPRDCDGAGVRAKLGLSDKVVLGFTGFMRDWHGLPQVIEAMAAMGSREDLHFLVIGEGPARTQLIEAAQRHGMEQHLTVLGLVERDQVAAHVAAFDIALQPRVVDYASPLKLFEYMALGRAIIAPDQRNIREVLTHGENALLFAPDDPESFRAAIMRLCGDATLRMQLGEAAARTVDQRGLTWSDNARRVIALVGGE